MMHFRKPSEPKHQDDNKSIKSDMASRRSVSLGSPAPTQFSHSRPATQITLPDSLGGISEGISWDIPHLGDLDLSGPLLSEKPEPVVQTRSPSPPRQPSQPPSRPATQQSRRGQEQTPPRDAAQPDAATERDGGAQPLSSAIDIILARSRVYAPSPRNEQPWWTTRTAESAAAAERARSKLQDQAPPPGTELYLIYPVDGCDARQTRSVDKHLEGSVEAYAMQRSNLFEGVLFWRAFLTTSQMELIRAMPEVGKVQHQPKPRPQSPKKEYPDYTPSRANPLLDLTSPARVGKELYQIEPRECYDPRVVPVLAARLENMVAPGDLYTNVITGGILDWRAFLTASECEELRAVPEIGEVVHWTRQEEDKRNDPTYC
ncbi:hypothetical protein PG984_010124 [Apiospora sp. TS-2023a]